ncbi:MAG: hypothetical protein RXR52_17240 [Paraburkholderia sp.]|jgi:hypothetical protein|nr:hypothetical protein [Paraburkholderia sp. USG1]MDR8394818.1 hypothetical protein [Paraburkholderia sp. USG1]
MPRWHALFLVLLMIVSLPIQSTAATQMPCEFQSGMSASLSTRDMRFADLQYGDASRYLPDVMGERQPQYHHDGSMHGGHGVRQCGMSAPCCVSAVALASSPTMPGREIAILHVGYPASDAATRFLTGGIERPPRLFLA